MESWSYVSGGKGIVCEESLSVNDGLGQAKDWELKSPGSCGSSSSQQVPELGSSNLMRIRDDLTKKLSGGCIFGSSLSAFSWEDKSSSKLSRSTMELNSRDSSLIDLKLGRFPEHIDRKIFKSPKVFVESIIPAKRMRAGSVSSPIPFCLVLGCGKDLSTSKDYHKRHKVCEIHSKTAKVIVNGTEQRFCQQCSRFHLLAEFDDGKRSCRKRLAGHNERRRKPHTGTRFRGTFYAASSLICEDVPGDRLLHQPNYEMNEWYRNVKVEDGVNYSHQHTAPFTIGQLQPKTVFSSYHTKKQFPPLRDEGMPGVTRNKINESSNSSLRHMGGSDFVSPSLFDSTCIGTQVLHPLDVSSSTIHGNSSNALSLLSSQSHDLSSHSTSFPTIHPLISQSSNSHYNATQVSKGMLGVGPQASASSVSSMFNSVEGGLEQILSPSKTFCINGNFQGSNCLNTKDPLSCEGRSTINLLQLSSQLQQVEHQRFSIQVKQDTDAFPGLRIT